MLLHFREYASHKENLTRDIFLLQALLYAAESQDKQAILSLASKYRPRDVGRFHEGNWAHLILAVKQELVQARIQEALQENQV